MTKPSVPAGRNIWAANPFGCRNDLQPGSPVGELGAVLAAHQAVAQSVAG